MTTTKTMRRLFAGVMTLSMAAGFVAAPVHFELDGTRIAMKSSEAFARRGRGADDGANHDVGDDKGGLRGGKGRGRDDGANHKSGDDKGGTKSAKGRGGDDGRGDDRGGRGRGRGTDDGPNHR